MLGAIIGDIIGSRWEFNPTNDYNFELFSDKNSFTDDTICTIAVADALLHNSNDYGAYIHKWCRKYPNPMGGYGGRFAQWVRSDNPQPYGSFGNGSAMRVSPIGWWFGFPQDLYKHGEMAAACTHNHDEGILGAQTVAIAIADVRVFRKDLGRYPTPEDIDEWTIPHAIMQYYEWPQNFKLNIEDYRNKFDETCRGTVPPAMWIILHSKSFEDAIRQAVSLGADADTIGAIVGSIAEPLWGIPEWMKQKALSYLPEDMKAVVKEFHNRVKTLRKLTKENQYYVFGEFTVDRDTHQQVFEIEREWAHEIAADSDNSEKVLGEMLARFPYEQWEERCDRYDLPMTLVGYIARNILKKSHKTLRVLDKFLEDNYSMRKKQAAKKLEEKQRRQQMFAIMFWKLALGDLNKIFEGKDPLPDKSKTATADDWQIEPMPDNPEDTAETDIDIKLTGYEMKVLRKGHIPAVMEDHWFMYCDEESIRYYRSWTGICAFEAKYRKTAKGFEIFRLKMNKGLAEFGVNGNDAGVALFKYLIAAETGGDADRAWQNYLQTWQLLNEKYK